MMATGSKKSDRTKKKIADAAIAFMNERDLADVTVLEIADAAGVSRQSFYYHFSGIFDVFIYLVKKEMKFAYPNISGKYFSSPYECVLDYCQALRKYKDLFYKFVYSGYRINLIDDFRTFIHTACQGCACYIMGDGCSEESKMVFARFHAEGYIAIVHEWVESHMEMDIVGRLQALVDGFHLIYSDFVFARADENRIA